MMLDKCELPTETVDQLSRIHHDCEQAVIAAFLKAAIFDSDMTYQNQMKVLVLSFTSFTQLEDSFFGLCRCKNNNRANVAMIFQESVELK